MAFYSPTESTFTRHYREELAMVLSTIDCVLNGRQAIYASTELTSGQRVFDLLRQHNLKKAEQLKERFGVAWRREHVLDANIVTACAFAKTIRDMPGQGEVITPAPFFARDWSQEEYLSLWEELVRTRIHSVWFNDAWPFSNGCTFEFAVAQDQRIPTFDARGRRLTVAEGMTLINEAIASLDQEGFETAKLCENRDRLTKLPREVAAVP